MQFLHAFDSKEITSYSADFSSHGIEHLAQLLHIRLASGVIDSGCSFCQHGRHNDVRSTGDRRFVKQHIRTFEMLAEKTVCQQVFVVAESRAEIHHALEMRVQTPATDFVSTRLGICHFAQTRQKRTDEHNGTTQFIAFLEEVRAAQISRVKAAGGEGVLAFRQFLYRNAHRCEQVDEVIHIEDVRQIINNHRLFCQQHCAKHLQRFVLRALRRDRTVQFVSSFYDK